VAAVDLRWRDRPHGSAIVSIFWPYGDVMGLVCLSALHWGCAFALGTAIRNEALAKHRATGIEMPAFVPCKEMKDHI
jgi:hypothetical protein